MDTSWCKSSFSAIDCVEVGWRKSSLSQEGNCIEINPYPVVRIRNSNNPEFGLLTISREAMSSWIDGIKTGEFDSFSREHAT